VVRECWVECKGNAGHCGRFIDLNWLTEWIEKGKSVGAAA
jgi:hypothetical protein